MKDYPRQLPFPGFDLWLLPKIADQTERLVKSREGPAKAHTKGSSSRPRRLDRSGTIKRAVGREAAGGSRIGRRKPALPIATEDDHARIKANWERLVPRNRKG